MEVGTTATQKGVPTAETGATRKGLQLPHQGVRALSKGTASRTSMGTSSLRGATTMATEEVGLMGQQ